MERFTSILVLFGMLLMIGRVRTLALDRIEDKVQEILNILRERESYQGITDVLNIDSTLKKLEQQNAEILKRLGSASGRSGVATEVQSLEVRIDSMEDNVVNNVKGGLKKIDDVQKQADSIRSEMEKRLGKMMNLMTSVYQLNERISSSVEKGPGSSDNDENSAIFMSERMDALEKMVSESVSIARETLMAEIRKIKLELIEPFSECRELTEQVEDMKAKCSSVSIPEMTKPERQDSSHWQSRTNSEHMINDLTESVRKNLTRVQREINENINKKLQDLENRISASQPLRQTTDYNTRDIETDLRSRLASATPAPTHRSPTVVLPTRPTRPTRPTTTVTTTSGPEKTKECNTLRYEVTKPNSCYELKQAGASCSGPYIIYPKEEKAVYAYCDMEKDGGGWTVLMRRGNYEGTQVNFNQNWKAYKEGFGDINKEFWLGNENIRMLTSGHETMVLQVSMEAFDGSKIDITYDQFWVESEDNFYKMHLGNADSSQAYLSSSFRHHNGQPFTTYDRKLTGAGNQDCATRFRGGWWYNRCHFALLTAPYFAKDQFRHKWQGMQWHAWKGNEALKAAEMRIRPKTY